jgi:lipopolysaccharide/colanic/teichoic acid biosynthesis glycosyltransferase
MNLDPAHLARVQRDATYSAPTLQAISTDAPFYGEIQPLERYLKRTFDIVFSIVGLTAFGLVLPILALAIKLDSRGSVFYSQIRLGINRRAGDRRREDARQDGDCRRDESCRADRRKVVVEGRPFAIYKLRTMFVNAESDGVRWAEKADPRITRVGNFLRLTRLDEFPQFWNVLKGEMSIVGPRPERPPFISLLSDEIPGYLQRLKFKPGITGLAQVENGYDSSIESVHRKVDLDVAYMSRFSLWLDLKILWKSVRVVLTGEGAF